MRQRYFVTATGTGVGKTFITATLARQAKALGKSVAAYKPVISGFDPAEIGTSDTGILLTALDMKPSPENIARISPWRFKEPLAPSMAARNENRALPFENLVTTTRIMISGLEDVVLIEGVGGAMVPLDDKRHVIDWLAALDIPALLVAGSYLGTLSHTLTALAALQHHHIPIRAVIVSESEGSDVSLEATAEELAHRTQIPLVALKRNSNGNSLRWLLD
jgi:dethiobiotin synthetase